MEGDGGCRKAEKEATEVDRKGESRALGPHSYNQPYDLEQAK